MANLVVCCDGTWNTADQEKDGIAVPTNVVKLFNALAPADSSGTPQQRYYHPGVGSEGAWWQKVAGGAYGFGLDKNIMSAYKWLSAMYNSGDRLFLFGFSRGAFTARSLGGLIARCGLLQLAGLPDSDAWSRVETAYREGYRNHRPDWAGTWELHHDPAFPAGIPIHFIGVWDTVGALGVPDDLAILNLFDRPEDYRFHDTALSPKVINGRHAVALDEARASFTPTLWTAIEDRPTVKQIWFPGCHCDVGGGYAETGLSDGALKWMIDEAQSCGLAFNPAMVAQLTPSAQALLHDAQCGLFRMLRSQPRNAPPFPPYPAAPFHDSAIARQAVPPINQAPYWATTRLAAGDRCAVDVFAAQPWNAIGIYLELGATYEFSATGEWLDSHVRCTPAGPIGDEFQVGEIVQAAATLWGKVERIYGKVSHDEEVDFRGTRRREDMPWLGLVGAIANGGNPQTDGTPAPMEFFLIGNGCTRTITKPGYLYCFANDAWGFYGNNHGSVRLAVRRA